MYIHYLSVVKDAKKAIKVEKHVTVLCQEIKEGNN